MSRRKRRSPQPNIEKAVQNALAKALNLPAGASTQQITAGYLNSLQLNGGARISGSAALARDPYNNYPFGPGEPLYPSPIGQILSTGRQPPQRFDYPVSWNMQTTTTRHVPWSILRDAADQVSVVRTCIDTCQSAVTGLDWSFGIDSARARALAKRADTSSHAVIADLQDKYADDIDRLHTWWQRPDRINNWTFIEWMTALLEDELVLDAVALYPHMTLGGDLHSMEIIDSTMIKPLLDDRGAVPQAPYAAYQQIREGFPRGEYSQYSPERVDREFVSAIYGSPKGPYADTDVLIYKVRHRRSRSPYGFSCVEQALADIDLWLKRFDWLRAEYTAGTTPEMIIKVDAAMTPEQLRQYEAVWNDDLSGRTAERHRTRMLPAGFDPMYQEGFEAKFASDLDLHLIRLICAAFDVLPTSIGFTPNHGMGGMGGMGHQQGEQDSQLMRGTKPRAKWLTSLINEISHDYLDMPAEVTFNFHGLDDEDEQKEATLLEGYINNGLMVLNEGRDRLNLPRYTVEQANEPFLDTPTGPAYINPKVQPVGMPGNLPTAQQNQPGQAPGQAPKIPGNQPVKPSGEQAVNTKPRDEQVQGAVEKRAEQKAFLQFAKKRRDNWRDFEFTAHDPDIAKAANNLAAAGDVDAVKALFTFHDNT